jgi:sugar phosphate isomerase/epimerase
MRRIWATPGLDDLPVAEWKRLLTHLSKQGFVGIEPLIAGPYALPLETIHTFLQDSGLAITGLRTGAITEVYGVTLGHPDPAVRNEAVARLNDVIRYGSHFGQPRILVGLMQGPLEPGQTVAQAEEYIIDGIRLCADEAARYGMEIDVEPVNRYELGYHSRVKEVIAVIRRVNRPNVRILLDTFHMNIEESSIGAALVCASSLFGHVHLGDTNRLPPGMGHFDFREFFAILRSLNYRGNVTVEAIVQDHYEAARVSARYLDCVGGSDW